MSKTSHAVMVAALVVWGALPAAAQSRISPVNNAPVDRHIDVPAVSTLNQPPNQVNGLFADSACGLCPSGQQSIADNFVINSAGGSFRVEQLVTWGGYFPAPGTPNVTDTFTIRILNSAGTLPGSTVLFSVTGIPASTRVATGVVLFGVQEFMFTFNLAAPPTLPNGTYWIEIFNSTAANAGEDFFWETGNLDATHGVLNGAFATATPGATWSVNPGESAIQINGTDQPVELQGFSVE
jgi:hypothetical protein